MDSQDSLTENQLFKRFLFTVFALLVYRLGVHIPTPGVNAKALVSLANQYSGGFLKLLNMFSGGALSHFSVLALGVMPYISSSIIVQLMSVVLPALEQLQKEGGVGRQKLTRLTRAFAVLLALIQGYLLSMALEAAPETAAGVAVLEPGFGFRLLAMLVLTTGTCFVMWLGEQISEKGLGNGISLLIFAGIVATLPGTCAMLVTAYKDGSLSLMGLLGIGLFSLALVFFVAWVEQSFRKIPMHYAKRVMGAQRTMAVQVSYLPLKVNMSGVIPAIFASTVLSIPISLAGFYSNRSRNLFLAELTSGRWLYNAFFAALVLFFCFVYTSITFKADDIAENLKRQNAYIPGIRPGVETAEALGMVVLRLTLAGAVYMDLVVLMPAVGASLFGQQISFGGTSLLIVVGVALETIRQVTSYMASQNYETLVFNSSSSPSA